MPKHPTWVVKLGGSLVGSAALPRWLAVLAQQASRHRVIVVAGGGPFADVVREWQPALGVTDRTAHHMAVQGMRQFALAIDALVRGSAPPRLALANDLLGRNGGPGLFVWEPLDPVLGEGELPQDWTATSDSIAAWLGMRLGATGVVLVKSREPAAQPCDAAGLARESFVDRHLPILLQRCPVRLWWLHRAGHAQLGRLFAGEDHAANRIMPAAS